MAQMNAEIATWLARRKDVVNSVPDSRVRYRMRRSELYFVVLHQREPPAKTTGRTTAWMAWMRPAVTQSA
jgi:hypothetical protein